MMSLLPVKLLQRNVKRLILILLIILLPYGLLFSPALTAVKHFFQIKHPEQKTHLKGENKCIVPKFKLWPEEFKQYYTKPEPLVCSSEENWIYIHNGTYRFSESAVKKYGNIMCEAITLVRQDEFAVLNGNRIKPLRDGDPIQSDFSEVRCVSASGKVFKSLLSGILPTISTQNRINPGTDKLNILMFGFDSVSRLNWIRMLPKSHEYFTSDLGGIVLEGYNIVGDGTPQALLPILTGRNETELPEARRGQPNATTVDGHPWIWKEMKDQGYVTQWGEDGQAFGTFTYRMLGFDKQPVDHYMRPFYMRAEMQYDKHPKYCLGSIPRHVNMLNWILELYKVYPERPKFSFLFHSEYSHDGYSELGLADSDLKVFLEYMKDTSYLNNTVVILMSDHGARFQKIRSSTQGKYEERMPYFGFSFPDWYKKLYPQAIEELRANRKRLTTPYDVHETLLDIIHHGSLNSRNNVVKKATQNKSPDHNSIPKKLFRKANNDITLKNNSALENFTNLSLLYNKNNRNKYLFPRSRGKSLLGSIDLKRTCEDAGIAEHWCTCLDWQYISTSHAQVQKAAKYLISTINEQILKPYQNVCKRLTVYNITSAFLYKPKDLFFKFVHSKDYDGRIPYFASKEFEKTIEEYYQITVIVAPTKAKFEATIKFDVNFSINVKDISRINRYGNQPRCIQDQLPHLRQFCGCISQFSHATHIIV